MIQHIDRMTTRFRLREILEARGLTQVELARQSKVPLLTIGRLCRNSTAQVSLKTLDRLADSLGVAPGDLLSSSAPKPRRR